MHIGVCRLTMRLPENDDLKGKRRVLHSITTRLRSKFNIAVAEVDDQDALRTITLGITCVSNDSRHANSMISNAVSYVERIRGDAELLDYEVEIIEGI